MITDLPANGLEDASLHVLDSVINKDLLNHLGQAISNRARADLEITFQTVTYFRTRCGSPGAR